MTFDTSLAIGVDASIIGGMAIMDEPGLRERKKKNTREARQRVANRLLRDRGYHDVTIDQVVAEANVAHRTVCRY